MKSHAMNLCRSFLFIAFASLLGAHVFGQANSKRANPNIRPAPNIKTPQQPVAPATPSNPEKTAPTQSTKPMDKVAEKAPEKTTEMPGDKASDKAPEKEAAKATPKNATPNSMKGKLIFLKTGLTPAYGQGGEKRHPLPEGTVLQVQEERVVDGVTYVQTLGGVLNAQDVIPLDTAVEELTRLIEKYKQEEATGSTKVLSKKRPRKQTPRPLKLRMRTMQLSPIGLQQPHRSIICVDWFITNKLILLQR